MFLPSYEKRYERADAKRRIYFGWPNGSSRIAQTDKLTDVQTDATKHIISPASWSINMFPQTINSGQSSLNNKDAFPWILL